MGRVKSGRTKRQRQSRDERMAAGADQATQAYSEAVAFAFTDCDATWKHLEREPEERLFALLDRMAPCACGRIELDGRDVSRAGLTSVAASLGLPYARALLLASVDYAHRTGGCAQQGAVLHELVSAARPEGEPAELSALLERLRLVHQAGTKCQAVVDAFA
ncbi:hypothetical protein [Streptomyces rhizosphaerihabitans]|uniref:hypothetical protein n=1 Tax=Streptomyces rhizosphaerihabitans TaxID=1266770 RepID=UPI0021BF54B5|nr:hypothetical protein [Streptomyces rhizosphaerihabitans]MCT9004634.1 hypothetical protein [Streptomyces rhizosphaerihabitans]